LIEEDQMAQTVITLKKKATVGDLGSVLQLLKAMGYRGESKAKGNYFVVAVLDIDYQPAVLSNGINHSAIRRVRTI